MLLARVTYRQLAHWDDKGWVSPSGQAADGRSARRRYRTEDVVRIAALAHFRACGVDVGDVGPLMANFVAPLDPDLLVVLTLGDPPSLARVSSAGLRDCLTAEGLRAVFDPGPLLRVLAAPTGPPDRSR